MTNYIFYHIYTESALTTGLKDQMHFKKTMKKRLQTNHQNQKSIKHPSFP